MTKERVICKRSVIAHIMIVLMICGCILPLQTGYAKAATVEAPDVVSVSHSGSRLTVRWAAVSGSTGYQIQYANNRIFQKPGTVTVRGGTVTSKTIGKVSSSGDYYVRIRAYLSKSGSVSYSEWTHSANVRQNKTVTKKALKKRLKRVELKKAAKQKVPGFDTVQSACYGKGYVYYLLENRNISYSKGRCKIVKMKLKNKKVVKVSAPLRLSHGNDITYDTKRNRIVVSHSTPLPKQISVVSPKTLKVKYTRTVEISKDLYKLPRPKKHPNKYYNKYNGFGAIAYNRAHDQFVVMLRGSEFHHLMFLNSNFEPVRFQYVGTQPNQMLQGIDSYGNYTLVSQSYSKGKPYNNIMVYDWDGNYLSKLNLGKKYELESVFHTGKAFYANFYTSFYKYKIGKGYRLQRNNYIYKLSGL